MAHLKCCFIYYLIFPHSKSTLEILTWQNFFPVICFTFFLLPLLWPLHSKTLQLISIKFTLKKQDILLFLGRAWKWWVFNTICLILLGKFVNNFLWIIFICHIRNRNATTWWLNGHREGIKNKEWPKDFRYSFTIYWMLTKSQMLYPPDQQYFCSWKAMEIYSVTQLP